MEFHNDYIPHSKHMHTTLNYRQSGIGNVSPYGTKAFLCLSTWRILLDRVTIEQENSKSTTRDDRFP